MLLRKNARRALALAVCAALSTPLAAQADLTWDVNGVAAGSGGSGNWNTTSPFWFTGSFYVAWNNSSPQLAIFGPTAGTVTLTTAITATSGLRFDTAGYVIQSNTLTLGGTVTTNANATIASTVAGTGFNKGGIGELTLAGSNTYSGAVVVNSGALVLSHNNALGTTAGSTTFNSGADLVLAGVNIGTENIVFTNVGSSLTSSPGPSANVHNGSLGISAPLNIQVDAPLTLGGSVSGSSNFTLTGSSALTLASNNFSWSGNPTINSSTLVASDATALGAGTTLTFTGNSPTLRTAVTTGRGGSMVFNTTGVASAGPIMEVDSATTFTVSANITGTGQLRKTGAGVLLLSGTNNYTGTNLDAGTIRADNFARLAGPITLNPNTTLDITSGHQSIKPLTLLGAATININTGTVTQDAAATLSGSGGFIKTGTGSWIINGNNSYSGPTEINNGLLIVNQAGGLGSTAGATTITNGALRLNNTITLAENLILSGHGNAGVGAIRSSGLISSLTGSVHLQANSTIDVLGTGSLTISNGITGSAGLTKVGTGSLVLDGAGTYTGLTSLNAGSIVVRNNTSLGSNASGTTVAANAQLRLENNVLVDEPLSIGFGSVATPPIFQLNGNNTLAGSITLFGNSIITTVGGTLALVGSISGAHQLTLDGGGNYLLSGSNSHGATVINSITRLRHSQGLGTAAGGGTSLTNTSLLIGNNITVTGESLSLSTASVHNEDGNNTWTGPWIVNTDSSLAVAAGTTFSLSGTVSGPGQFTKAGLGELVLSQTNFHGSTRLTQGPVTVTALNGLGPGSLTIDGGIDATLLKLQANQSVGSLLGSGGNQPEIRLENNSSFTVNQTSAGTYFGTITGTGTFTKSGLASLTLTGNNSHDETSINGGTLLVSSDANLGEPGVAVQFGGGTLATTAAITSARDLVLGPASGAFESGTFNSTFNHVLGSGNFTKTGTGRLTVTNLRNSMADVSVFAGAIATAPNGAAAGISVIGTLTVAPSAALDLNDNDLVVNNGAFTDVLALVLAGFGNTTGGITSSTSDGTQILALFDNALVSASDWEGLPIEPNAIVGKYTYFGDVNIDGQVTGDDYTIVDSNLDSDPVVGLEWLSGDANLDGIVTGDDYTIIDSNLGLGAGNPLAPSRIGSSTAVPEPAALSILVLAPLLCRRSRRRYHAGAGPR